MIRSFVSDERKEMIFLRGNAKGDRGATNCIRIAQPVSGFLHGPSSAPQYSPQVSLIQRSSTAGQLCHPACIGTRLVMSFHGQRVEWTTDLPELRMNRQAAISAELRWDQGGEGAGLRWDGGEDITVALTLRCQVCSAGGGE